MGNSNLLGASSPPFVQKQIKVRQENLSVDPINGKTTKQIVWQNAKTSYVALASSVDIKNSPATQIFSSAPQQLIFPMDASTQQDLKDFSVAESTGVAGFSELELSRQRELAFTSESLASNDKAFEDAKNLPALELNESMAFARRLNTAFGTKSDGTDEEEIYKIYDEIKTVSRFNQVDAAFKSFFTQSYSDINTGIVKELSVDELYELNNNHQLLNSFELSNFSDSLPSSIPGTEVEGTGFNEEESDESSPNIFNGATFEELNKLESELLRTIPEGTEGTDRIRALKLPGTPDTYFDNTLAQNLVLTNSDKFGVLGSQQGVENSSYSQTDIFEGNYNYGFGDDPDWGLVAMPGLEGVDIKSKNMGSLREATVTIRANSEAQFKLLDTVYNRLGYTMFLEWGHSVFFNSKNEYVSNPIEDGVPSLIPQFLNAKDDLCVTARGKLQTDIQTNRDRSGGNYDAFLGLVTNFIWEFNQGGYYTITLKMSSIGDIIESLQIDQPLSDIEPSGEIPQQSIQESEISALSQFLTIAGTPNGKGVFVGGRWTVFGEFGEREGQGGEIIKNDYSNFKTTLVANNTFTFKEEPWWSSTLKNLAILPLAVVDAAVKTVNTGVSILTVGQVNPTAPNLYELALDDNTAAYTTSEKKSTQNDYSLKLQYKRPALHPGLIISGRAIFGKSPYSYIRFGDILDFIKDRLLIYNSICDNEPIVDIDTGLDSNFCYYTGANVSADPSKVMVAVDLPISKEYLQGFADKYSKQQEGTKRKLYWEHNIYTDQIFQYGEARLENFVTNGAFVGTKTNLTAGLIMNIYFEYDYLLDVIKSNRDSETNMLSLFDFISELLETTNSCLGGVNKLALRVEDDSILRIYDQNMIYGATQDDKKEDAILNLYGLKSNEGSFVHDFNMQTTLTNDFATQITIGAQAQGNAGTMDSGVLSSFNSGLIDRVKPKIITSSEKSPRSSTSKPQTTYENLLKTRDKLMYLWLGYAEGTVGEYSTPLSEKSKNNLKKSSITGDISDFEGVDGQEESSVYNFSNFPELRINEFVKLQKDFFALLHINSDYISNQKGMLPMSINANLDGLSGIRIYDKLRVDTRMIPDYYPQTLEWIIKGVSHSIQNNKWTTSLDTIAVPKLPPIPEGSTPLSSTKIKSYKMIPLEGIKPTKPRTPSDYNGAAQELGAGSTSQNGRLQPGDLQYVTKSYQLRKGEIADSFLRMAEALKAQKGITIKLNSAYRTFESQQNLFDWDLYVASGGKRTDTTANQSAKRFVRGSNGTTAVAFPGTSNHGLGKAIDVQGTKAQNWIKEFGWEYGWSWYEGKRANENHHFTYSTVRNELQDLRGNQTKAIVLAPAPTPATTSTPTTTTSALAPVYIKGFGANGMIIFYSPEEIALLTPAQIAELQQA